MASKSSSRSVHKGEVDLNWVMKYLKDGVYPPGLNFSEKRMVRKRAERFCYLNGDLFYLGTPTDQELGKKSRKVLLTHDERWQKVEELHVSPDGTHNGLEKTADAIVTDYHWNGIYKFIKDFIRQCAACREKRPYMLPVTQTQATSDVPTSDPVFTVNNEEVVEQTEPVVMIPIEGDHIEDQAQTGIFWEKVEIRLLGPYKVRSSNKHIMIFVDCFTKWCEALVVDSVSPASVAHSLLMVISRYGVMSGILMSKDDEVLEDALVNGLEMLDTESNIQIPFLVEERDSPTDSLLKELEGVTEKFVKKYPNNWNQSYEFCLAPFRASCHKKSPHLPTHMTHSREGVVPETKTQKKGSCSKVSLVEGEKMKSAEALMSIQATLIIKDSGGTSPMIQRGDSVSTQGDGKSGSDLDKGQAVYVTRSRTGNRKPKTLGDDSYEFSAPKRKSSVTDTQTRKKIKIEVVDPTTESTENDMREMEEINAGITDKKVVDLDVYYKAIKMYVEGNGYPLNSSNSFKRLIRDQAKNYSIRDGELYHEVGNKGIWKKIIATKKERVQLLSDIFKRTSSKSQMLLELDSVHWKGKLIDCEAYVLSSPYSVRHEQKLYKDVSLRHLSENKKLLKFDTIETYNEIKNYVIYDVFSNDEWSRRLDYLKKQLKFFKVEKKELIYTMGNKRRKVLLTSTERQKAVQEAHLKKGTHADLTASFAQVAETCFWFGMKLDVKIYINYCCTTTQDNKHLIDRYFIFREHHMRNYEPRDIDMTLNQEDITDDGDSNQEELEVPENQDLQEGQDEETIESTASIDKNTEGVFVSSVNSPPKDLEKSMPNLRATLEAVESSLAMNAVSSGSIVTETSALDGTEPATYFTESVAVTEEIDDNSQMITEEVVEEGTVVTEEDHHEAPGTIILKVSDDGQSVLVTKTGRSKIVDDYTVEAVKSILPETESARVEDGNTTDAATQSTIGGDYGVDIKTEAKPEVDTENCEENMEIATMNVNEVEEENDDSEEMTYDTEEEEDEYYENELATQTVQGLTPGDELNTGGEKKQRPTFKCSQCHKVFFGPIKFKMHMYKHTGNKPFPCTQCNKKYTNKKSLVIHQRTHTGDLPYQCTLCGKKTPSKIALKSHLKCHDGNGGGFPAVCDICGREFTRKHLMERHKLHKHTNQQTEFKCQDCNKVFGHHRSLKRHYMSTHMGVKNHVCTLCGKRFYRKEYLTGHLLQHGGTATEGLPKRARASSFKPRPSLLTQAYQVKDDKIEQHQTLDTDQVQRIILHQDENGQLRVVDLETEREVKRMLESQMSQGEVGETTMVVHIEEPTTGQPQVVHVEQTEEQVIEVPLEGQDGVEYQLIQEDRPQEYVISGDSGSTSTTQYIYATSGGEIIQTNQDLVYEQPAVQYEVECVGDVGDEEALSAINLLAQASAQQYETVISQI